MNLKKSLAVVLSLLLVMMTTVSVFAESAESASDTNEVKTSKNAQKEKDIKIDARNAIVYCENTGEIIYTKNIHERVEPFSIT